MSCPHMGLKPLVGHRLCESWRLLNLTYCETYMVPVYSVGAWAGPVGSERSKLNWVIIFLLVLCGSFFLFWLPVLFVFSLFSLDSFLCFLFPCSFIYFSNFVLLLFFLFFMFKYMLTFFSKYMLRISFKYMNFFLIQVDHFLIYGEPLLNIPGTIFKQMLKFFHIGGEHFEVRWIFCKYKVNIC